MAGLTAERDMTLLNMMSDNDKLIFVKTLVRLADADGNIDEGEKEFITKLFKAFELSETLAEEIKATTDEEVVKLAANISNRQVAMELIKEMCMLANSDGDLSDREIVFIGKVGLAMNLELEKIEQISQWVIDRIIWLEEGKIIFEKV